MKPIKKVKSPEKDSNDNKQLMALDDDTQTALDSAQDFVTNLLGKTHKKSERYYLLRHFGFTGEAAAKACGYTPSYFSKLDRKYRNDLKLQTHIAKFFNRIPEQYKQLSKLRLIDLAEAEAKAVLRYKEDPDLLISKPQLAKHLRQTAGVMADDCPGSVPVINIEAVQNLMIKTCRRDNRGNQEQEEEC
jgi:hypothetical protein